MAGSVMNLMVRAGADFSQLESSMNRAQSQVDSFGSRVTTSLGRLGLAVEGLKAIFYGLKEAFGEPINDAMRFEALMNTLSETLGSSTNDFIKWQDTVGRSLGYSKLQSTELANTLSLNFKSISSSQEDLMNKTTKMMEVASLVAQKRGMAMTEVSDRIRSAMNQEADGADELGVNVRVSAIQQSEAYKKMADGRPWAELSTNMQKTILYQHILESVSQNLGTTVQDSVLLRMNMFKASLGDLRVSLGQAFLPILNVALPLLTRLADRMAQVFSIIAQFTQALFGKANSGTGGISGQTQAINQQSSAIDGLAGAHDNLAKAKDKSSKAGKKDDGFLASFDEVHTVDKKSDSGSSGSDAADGGASGGVGGGALGGLIGDPGQAQGALSKVSEGVRAFAEKVKAFFAPIGALFMKVWDVVSDYFKDKIKGITDFWNEHGALFIKGMQNIWNFLQPIIMFIVKFIWDSIKGTIDGVIRFFEGLMEFIGGVFTGHWKEAFQGLWDMVLGFIQAAWNIFNLIFIVEIGGMLKGFVMAGKELFIQLAEFFRKPLGDFMTWLLKAFWDTVKGLRQFFGDFGSWMDQTGLNLAHRFLSVFETIGNSGKYAWEVIKATFSGAYDWFMRTMINPIITAFNSIKDGFSQGFGSGLKAIANSIIDVLNSAIDNLNGLIHLVPGAGSVNIPHVPHLYKGGITNGPTMAVIGDNAGGQEVISPLDRLTGIVTNAVLTAMSYNNSGSNSSTGGDIILNIDGRQFARIIKPYTDLENRRVGTNVRLQSL